MSYLARLKQLESGEIFHNTPKPEPTKPTKPPFDGFVGSIPGANENIYIEKGLAETDSTTAHGRWLVHFADREPVEVYCNPDADLANIMQTYPDALAAEPIPERIKRVFTEAENAEWEALWLGVPDDDRITCTQCAKLRGRVCTAAGGAVNALKGYMPILEILRRCEGYAPLKTTMEQRVTHRRTGTKQVTTND